MKTNKFKLNMILALGLLSSVGGISTTYAQEKLGSFDVLISPADVFKNNGRNLEKIKDRDDLNFEHEDISFAVVADRVDGTVATVLRQPSFTQPNQYFYMGYFFNCDQQLNIPMIFENQKELKELISSAPGTFEKQLQAEDGGVPFDDEMIVHDYFRLACYE